MLGLLSQQKILILGHFHGQRQSHFMMIHDQLLIAVCLVEAEQAISWVNFLP